MSPNDASPTAHRRRGAALEAALLDAAWDELLESGYDALTYDAVAERASTSRAVLYRRWPTKPELARAAVERGLAPQRVTAPDTGSLRGDVLSMLEQLNDTRIRVAVAVIGRLGPYFHDTGTTIGELRDTLTATHRSTMDTILEQAITRGDLIRDVISPRVARLPLDLFRHEVLTTLRSVPSDTITGIVDDIFIPLVTALNAGERDSSAHSGAAFQADSSVKA